jgi:hypothetical protein
VRRGALSALVAAKLAVKFLLEVDPMVPNQIQVPIELS